MRFAIFGDVHANLEALNAVLKDARERQCTHHAFLGDIVGYNADPKACLELVRAMNAPCVKGNHDEYCSTHLPLTRFNPKAARAVLWTRKQLNDEHRQWLRALPYVLKVENFTLAHGSLDDPQRWAYVFEKTAAAASFAHQKTPVCFFGHTHVPVVFVRDGTVRGGTFTKFKVEANKQYFINAGSVGQPRDNNPKAAYLVYDLNECMVELCRVEYDMETARRKIREAGLDA